MASINWLGNSWYGTLANLQSMIEALGVLQVCGTLDSECFGSLAGNKDVFCKFLGGIQVLSTHDS